MPPRAPPASKAPLGLDARYEPRLGEPARSTSTGRIAPSSPTLRKSATSSARTMNRGVPGSARGRRRRRMPQEPANKDHVPPEQLHIFIAERAALDAFQGPGGFVIADQAPQIEDRTTSSRLRLRPACPWHRARPCPLDQGRSFCRYCTSCTGSGTEYSLFSTTISGIMGSITMSEVVSLTLGVDQVDDAVVWYPEERRVGPQEVR